MTTQPVNVEDLMVLAFSTVGILLLVEGIRDFLGVMFLAHEFDYPAAEFWYNSVTLSALVQLALAFWLVLGSRGIVRVIHRLRTAGVTDPEHEPQGEDAA